MVTPISARAVLLRAWTLDRKGQRAIGTGTLIGGRQVLTAAHVVFDQSTHAPHQSILAWMDQTDQPFRLKVIAPDRFEKDSGDGVNPDVALCEILDENFPAEDFEPLALAKTTGQVLSLDVSAIVFPRSHASVVKQNPRWPVNTREALQVSMRVMPQSGRVTGRYEADLTTAPPVGSRGNESSGKSPWAGSSGAGVFTRGGALLGVVQSDLPNYSHAKISITPATQIRSSRRLASAIALDRGLALIESAELMNIVSTASSQRAHITRLSALPPSAVLRPEFEALQFVGRESLTEQILAWCDSSRENIDARLIVGPGGRGKSRFGRRVVDLMHDRRSRWGGGRTWVAGTMSLNADSIEKDLQALADSAHPVLIVIDYAEAHFDSLVQVLTVLGRSNAGPFRFLLLARSGSQPSGWWADLQYEARLVNTAPIELSLLTDEPGFDIRRLFAEAAGSLADLLPKVSSIPEGVDWSWRARKCEVPPDIDDAKYGNPLTLQLAALTALLNVEDLSSNVRARRSPEVELLDSHERKYWRQSSPQFLLESMREECVLAASLVPVSNVDEGVALLRRLPSLRGQPTGNLIAAVAWICSLYPPSVNSLWGSLQPDRLLEHLTYVAMDRSPLFIQSLLEIENPLIAEHLRRALQNQTARRPDLNQLAGLMLLRRMQRGSASNHLDEFEAEFDLPESVHARDIAQSAVDDFLRIGGPKIVLSLENLDDSRLADVIIGQMVVREVFDFGAVVDFLNGPQARFVRPSTRRELEEENDFALEQVTSWMLETRGGYVDIEAETQRFRDLRPILAHLFDAMGTETRQANLADVALLVGMNVPREVAARVVRNRYATLLLDAVELGQSLQLNLEELVVEQQSIVEQLSLNLLIKAIVAIPAAPDRPWEGVNRIGLMRDLSRSVTTIAGPSAGVGLGLWCHLGQSPQRLTCAGLLAEAINGDPSMGLDRVIAAVHFLDRALHGGVRAFRANRALGSEGI